MKPLRIGVVGAGAVGGYFGGILARGGHSVTLIARSAQVEAIESKGLRIESATWQATVGSPQLKATTDLSALTAVDGVLLCVKSGDTETVSAQIGPFLAPDCWVMSLQNGVDNANRASQVLGRAVIAAVVYVATAAPEPGLIRHFGRGDLIIGNPAARSFAPLSDGVLQDIADRFSDAGVPVKVSDAVTHALWSKLLVNCVFNGLSALSQMDYGTLAAHAPTRQIMQAILDEVLAVATAAGTPLTPAEAAEATDKIIQGMPRQRSSTAQDLVRRKLTEIDHLNGFIAREGLRLGVPTPVNSTVHGLVKLLESGF